MRQTTEHRPYIGLAAVLSYHGQSSAFRSTGHRPGFTLIEVMIALVIIGLATFGLAVFSMQSYNATQNLVIRATAQNLAEVTLEEVSAMPGGTLYTMTHSSDVVDVNFPGNGYVEAAQEAWNAASAYDSSLFNSSTKAFTVIARTYHVLCNGQLVLGTYGSFFGGTGTVGSIGGAGAVVKTPGGTSDLFQGSSWSSIVVTTGPIVNDYSTLYGTGQIGLLPSLDLSSYVVYKYRLGSGFYIEPINQGRTALPDWEKAGLLVFASTAPHVYRDVTVTDTTDATLDASAPKSTRMYQINVRVIWTFGGVRQLVQVTGGRTQY